jgi:hypothetical protein
LIHAVERPRASLAQIGLAMLAVLALTFSFFTLAQPVRADHVEGSTVWLNQDLGTGVDSSDPGEYAGSDEECADVEEGTVLFHFVANQLAEGTTVAGSSLTATFSDHADVTVDGYSPSGDNDSPSTIHFDVVLDASATLTGAYAHFNVAQTEDTNLLLSHVCDKTDDEVEEDLTLIKQVNGEATAGIGFTLEGWSELFTDASGEILFEDLTEGDWTLTETTNPNEDCETGGSVTIHVAADGSITVTDDDETDGLVIVSFDAETNVLVLNNVCEADQGLLEVEKFFCPTEGDARTEIDIFGPADPQARTMTEGEDEPENCSVGADVAFTVYASDGETIVTTFVTDELGIAEVWLDPGDYVLCEDMSGACEPFTIAEGAVTAAVVVNYVPDEEQPGTLEVEKFFCPTDGETRTEFDVFGPVDPIGIQSHDEGDLTECEVGEGVTFTLYSVGEEWVEIDTLVTDESGIIEIELAPGDYALCEDMSEECVEFTIGEGQFTAIVVVNYVAQQGQIKVLKYFCEAEDDSVEFYLEGEAPNLENCDPGDAQFMVDDGEPFWTEGGIAVVWADEGTHTLTEVSTEASVELEVVAGEITTVIVLNNLGDEDEQGQVKVLKYECEADEDGVEFFMEGEAPNLEDCDPADAEFTLDDGDPFSTSGGIAVQWADEGTHVLAEVSTGAWVELDVVAGEITTVIVLNNVESGQQGGGETPDNGGSDGGNGVDSGVQGGQGGPGGGLPDTAMGDQGGLPAGILALLMLAGLGGIGAANLQSVRRRIG